MCTRIALLAAVFLLSDTADASYAIYVGKNLTKDGSTLIGGSGDEVSSHWLEVVPAADHGPAATITVGVTAEATMPGELIEIPQAPHTYRYLTDYSLKNAGDALRLGNALLASIEARTSELFGYRKPQTDVMSGGGERLDCLVE